MSNAWIDAQRREEDWPIRLLTGKDLPPDPELPAKACRLVVTAGLRWPPGHPSPHFSVTAELIDRAKHRSEWTLRVGPQHERVLKHFPELAPIVALHERDTASLPDKQTDHAINLLLAQGATDNRVATAVDQARTSLKDAQAALDEQDRQRGRSPGIEPTPPEPGPGTGPEPT